MKNEFTDERIYTGGELRRYDGENGTILIAYKGVVYDVTSCPKWRTGIHEGLHFPGQDLTSEVDDAPHGEEVFKRPCIRRVGRLKAG